MKARIAKIEISPEDWKKLKIISLENNMPLQRLIGKILEDYIRKQEEEKK